MSIEGFRGTCITKRSVRKPCGLKQIQMIVVVDCKSRTDELHFPVKPEKSGHIKCFVGKTHLSRSDCEAALARRKIEVAGKSVRQPSGGERHFSRNCISVLHESSSSFFKY